MEDIYNEYAVPVYKYLFTITSDHSLAEELTQETFYQAMISIHRYNSECKLLVWLCQIAKHLYFDHLKKGRHRGQKIGFEPLDEKTVAPVQDLPEAALASRESLHALYRQLHKLQEPYKEVMLLRISGELSFKDIGEIMGHNENWARVTYYRAKTKLLKGMDEYG